jgi:SAM-dependent methyltransferase
MITDDQVKAIEALGAKYPGHYMAKFCVDPRRWDREAEELAAKPFNDDSVCSSLDIGCGFGYFVNACDLFGDSAWGLDIGDPLIIEASGILRAKVAFGVVKAYVELPWMGRGTFDIITMFGCTLRHGHPATSKDYWGWDEYRFLFADVLGRLNPGGQFVIRPHVMGDEYGSAANLLACDTFTDKIGDLAEIEYEGLQITLRRKP